MLPAEIVIQRVEHPSEQQVDAAVKLFTDLMGSDSALKSLVGGDLTLTYSLASAMLRAGIQGGEYYEAAHTNGELAGFLMTMPAGHTLFGTEERRALGLTDFMSKLSPEGKEYYRTTYMVEFPAFVDACVGPNAIRDTWYVHTLMVRREYQGQGIGKSLVRIVRDKVRITSHSFIVNCVKLLEQAQAKDEVVAISTTTALNAEIYQKMGLTLLGEKIMPSPWGDWPMYILADRPSEFKARLN